MYLFVAGMLLAFGPCSRSTDPSRDVTRILAEHAPCRESEGSHIDAYNNCRLFLLCRIDLFPFLSSSSIHSLA